MTKSPFRNRRTENRRRTYRSISETCGAASTTLRHRLSSSPTSQNPNRSTSLCKAIATIPEPSRQPERRPCETPFQYQTPAREALQAVSTRTRVPIADILGRNRRPPIAAARHEAVWRVRLATGWSLPRLGRFFKRDHTTLLHFGPPRWTKRSAQRSRTARAYMTPPCHYGGSTAAPTTLNSSHFSFAPSPLNLRLMSEGEKDGYR